MTIELTVCRPVLVKETKGKPSKSCATGCDGLIISEGFHGTESICGYFYRAPLHGIYPHYRRCQECLEQAKPKEETCQNQEKG